MPSQTMVLALVAAVLCSLQLAIAVPTKYTDVRGFVPEPSGRGTISILSSCSLTLIICLWTSLHLTIPPPNNTVFQRLRRRLKWIFFICLVPEMTAASSLQQYVFVKSEIRKINALPNVSDCADSQWTLMDGFYANMGGIILVLPSRPDGVAIDTSQIVFLVKNNRIHLPPSSFKIILDKSKADGIAKVLACLQVSWLLAQSLARAMQHLPLTTLELTTVAYVFFTIITYLALLHKPLNVLTPSAPITLLPAEDGVDADDGLLEAIQVNMVSYNQVDRDKCLIPYRRNRTLLGDYALPSYLNTINMIFIVSPLYGAWHCLAWQFYFPTHAELLLWRSCVVCIIVCPPLVAIMKYLRDFCEREGVRDARKAACHAMFVFFGTSYVLARMAMIVEMFVDLRSLPVGVFETVQWVNFVPHL